MLEVPSSSMIPNKVIGEKRCLFTRHNKSTTAYQISRDSLAQCIIQSLLHNHYHYIHHTTTILLTKFIISDKSTVSPRFGMFVHVRIPRTTCGHRRVCPILNFKINHKCRKKNADQLIHTEIASLEY